MEGCVRRNLTGRGSPGGSDALASESLARQTMSQWPATKALGGSERRLGGPAGRSVPDDRLADTLI